MPIDSLAATVSVPLEKSYLLLNHGPVTLVTSAAEPGSVLADASSEEHNTPSAAARAAIDTPAGSYYLPLNQPWAALAVAALEPEAPGGFQASGLLGGAARSARVMAAPTLVFEEPD